MHIHKYLKKLDCEIDELICKEGHNLTAAGERNLHVLLENRKHVSELLEERESESTASAISEPRKASEKHSVY